MRPREGKDKMIAAIYARKSTEQNGADADAKSVARQIENARAFAAAKGWTVADAHVYADDAVSGAETRKLVNRQRLLDTIRTGPPFQVLILRDASRFNRRDGDEAFSELKAIDRAGVKVWYYSDGQQFTYGDLGSNVVGFVRAEMNAEFRRQIAKWTREAMVRKAQAGYVTGGRVFGYDNLRVDGHVERRINEAEAAVVQRVYELYAAGHGLPTIAHTLNANGAPLPAGTARPRTRLVRVLRARDLETPALSRRVGLGPREKAGQRRAALPLEARGGRVVDPADAGVADRFRGSRQDRGRPVRLDALARGAPSERPAHRAPAG